MNYDHQKKAGFWHQVDSYERKMFAICNYTHIAFVTINMFAGPNLELTISFCCSNTKTFLLVDLRIHTKIYKFFIYINIISYKIELYIHVMFYYSI